MGAACIGAGTVFSNLLQATSKLLVMDLSYFLLDQEKKNLVDGQWFKQNGNLNLITVWSNILVEQGKNLLKNVFTENMKSDDVMSDGKYLSPSDI